MAQPELSVAEHTLLHCLSATTPHRVLALVPTSFPNEGAVLQAADRLVRDGYVKLDETRQTVVRLTATGAATSRLNLPEARARAALAAGPLALAELTAKAQLLPDEARIIVGLLKRTGSADAEKTPGGLVLRPRADAAPGDHEAAFTQLSPGQDAADSPRYDALVERGLVERITRTERSLLLTAKGVELRTHAPAPVAAVGAITPEFIADYATWPAEKRRAVAFQAYDLSVPVAAQYPAKPHPLTQMLGEIRSIFWRMGFQEIAGDYVESAYWNMDALFIPQDHPARDMQDTFYLSDPAWIPIPPADLDRAAGVHEQGGATGSTGWGGVFDRDVARRALLRTHTTNTTVRYLAQHPKDISKVFGLGRVFRKETMDATHLPEFTQIEGIVVEPGATFDTLVGLCRYFFGRMGFPQVRFRPAYFPYTEPSMEIEVHYNGRWMELGGCGIFRPEVTKPLGVEHNVLAWGFGLERLAMMRLGLKDIRQLYISDVQWLREAPLQ